MTKFPAIFALILSVAFLSFSAQAQETPSLVVQALNQIIPSLPAGQLDYDLANDTWTGTNGVFVSNGSTVMTADSASINSKTGEVKADGHVRIESGEQVWVGDHIDYNFKTHQMRTEQFRTGKSPVFAGATGLSGNSSNRIYTARNAFVTTDDIENPAYKVRASKIKIIPGKSVEMWNAVLVAEGIPVFYFPYYKRNLGPRSNNLMVTPGFRSAYGGFLLGTYTWFLNDEVDGKIHVDYRIKRGVGLGPDVNLNLGRWGNAEAKFYYLDDQRPNTGTNFTPWFNHISHNRERVYFGWQATPATNLNLKALVNYQSDPLVLRDFFTGDYNANPQPNTFIEANKYWDNWSLNGLATPRVNDFFNQIERLPDIKLTGFRQQVLNTPIFYDSESSLGWFRGWNANTTNGFYALTNGFYGDSAMRGDTYHQFTLPLTFFNFLNVAPRAGGRFTYYSHNPAGTVPANDISRTIFNTGIGASFKATALWTDAKSSFFDVDGLRHIIEPSANYIFVPNPGHHPAELPQFDSEMAALLISPITFPDYNSIDSIDTMNVIRFGLRNVLQTKRDGQLDDVVNWNLMMDYRLDRQLGQSDLNDLYSALSIRPRTWLTLESQVRYDVQEGKLNLSFHQLTIAPNDRWSWGIGHLYLRHGNWGGGNWDENDFLTSTAFLRLSDNWGLRAQHNFNIKNGRLQQQFYSIYRDMRSWTLAMTFRVQDDVRQQADYTVAFQLSLKASPSQHLGEDVANPYHLIGE